MGGLKDYAIQTCLFANRLSLRKPPVPFVNLHFQLYTVHLSLCLVVTRGGGPPVLHHTCHYSVSFLD